MRVAYCLRSFIGLVALAAVAQAAEPEFAGEEGSPDEVPPGEVPPGDENLNIDVGPSDQDLVGGHLRLAASVGYAWPFGRLDDAGYANDALDGAPRFGVDATIGVSRVVSLGLRGAWATSGLYSAGVSIRYHLVQGTRFDPWIAIGPGVTGLAYEDESPPPESPYTGESRDYLGVQWLNLRIGGDWFLTSGFAFGPFAGASFSTFFEHPDAAGTASLFYDVELGLRFAFDSPGR